MLAYDAQTRAVHTEPFDGPLELLLFLVRRQGVDVRQVRIAPVTDAFLAHIGLMEVLDLDVAGDFLVLAATLCLLKSRELLPRPVAVDDADDDTVDLREQLARRLLDYERYRDAALSLSARPWLDRDTFARNAEPVRGEERPVDPGVDTLGLLEVFYAVIQRHRAPPPVHTVAMETYSLEDMASWIFDRLRAGPRELRDLLRGLEQRADRVVAFLATLEMARLQMLDLVQEHHLGAIVLRTAPGVDSPDLSVFSGGVA